MCDLTIRELIEKAGQVSFQIVKSPYLYGYAWPNDSQHPVIVLLLEMRELEQHSGENF